MDMQEEGGGDRNLLSASDPVSRDTPDPAGQVGGAPCQRGPAEGGREARVAVDRGQASGSELELPYLEPVGEEERLLTEGGSDPRPDPEYSGGPSEDDSRGARPHSLSCDASSHRTPGGVIQGLHGYCPNNGEPHGKEHGKDMETGVWKKGLTACLRLAGNEWMRIAWKLP